MKSHIQAIVLAFIAVAVAFLFVLIGRETKPNKICNCRLLADTIITDIRHESNGWINVYDTLVFISKKVYWVKPEKPLTPINLSDTSCMRGNN